MFLIKVFLSLLLLSFFCLILCFFFLIIKKTKLIATLSKLEYDELAQNLTIIYIPIKGSSISDHEKSNFTWKKIQKLETNDIFLRRIQFLIKAINIIRIFITTIFCISIISGIIYLVGITNWVYWFCVSVNSSLVNKFF